MISLWELTGQERDSDMSRQKKRRKKKGKVRFIEEFMTVSLPLGSPRVDSLLLKHSDAHIIVEVKTQHLNVLYIRYQKEAFIITLNKRNKGHLWHKKWTWWGKKCTFFVFLNYQYLVTVGVLVIVKTKRLQTDVTSFWLNEFAFGKQSHLWFGDLFLRFTNSVVKQNTGKKRQGSGEEWMFNNLLFDMFSFLNYLENPCCKDVAISP